MPPHDPGRVALVTGANQGLGFAIVARLCATLGPGDLVYLTARDEAKGLDAIARIGDTASGLSFEKLDVADRTSVAACARRIAERHGSLDIVVSNAAARIAKDVPPSNQVKGFIDTNNHGTYRMLTEFVPMLRPHGRFVVVASSFGTLRNLPNQIHNRFDVGRQSLEDIEMVMDDYCAAVIDGTAGSVGWPEWINIPSKVGQVAAAKIAARDVGKNRPESGILINAACPGLVATEASRPWFDDMSQAQSPEAAAVDVCWLALLPPGTQSPDGELVQFRQVLPWTLG